MLTAEEPPDPSAGASELSAADLRGIGAHDPGAPYLLLGFLLQLLQKLGAGEGGPPPLSLPVLSLQGPKVLYTARGEGFPGPLRGSSRRALHA